MSLATGGRASGATSTRSRSASWARRSASSTRTTPTCSPPGPTRRTSGTRMRSLIRGSLMCCSSCSSRSAHEEGLRPQVRTEASQGRCTARAVPETHASSDLDPAPVALARRSGRGGRELRLHTGTFVPVGQSERLSRMTSRTHGDQGTPTAPSVSVPADFPRDEGAAEPPRGRDHRRRGRWALVLLAVALVLALGAGGYLLAV